MKQSGLKRLTDASYLAAILAWAEVHRMAGKN